MKSPIDITVIVPHLNQPIDLERCLRALADQQTSVSYEIIVVDNGSKSSPQDLVRTFPMARLLFETEPGPGPARSLGARQAMGKILAFTDADCIPSLNWLSTIWSFFQNHPDVDILGGDVSIFIRDHQNISIIEAYESVYGYRMKLYVERDKYAATLNMAVRKKSFEMIGSFGGIEFAEDMDWGRRASELQMKIEYVPDVKILTPARRNFSELKRKWRRQIFHDFKLIDKNISLRLGWFLRALAVFFSPIFEIGLVLTTMRISGIPARIRCFVGLVGVRIYRSVIMISLLCTGRKADVADIWNT